MRGKAKLQSRGNNKTLTRAADKFATKHDGAKTVTIIPIKDPVSVVIPGAASHTHLVSGLERAMLRNEDLCAQLIKMMNNSSKVEEMVDGLFQRLTIAEHGQALIRSDFKTLIADKASIKREILELTESATTEGYIHDIMKNIMGSAKTTMKHIQHVQKEFRSLVRAPDARNKDLEHEGTLSEEQDYATEIQLLTQKNNDLRKILQKYEADSCFHQSEVHALQEEVSKLKDVNARHESVAAIVTESKVDRSMLAYEENSGDALSTTVTQHTDVELQTEESLIDIANANENKSSTAIRVHTSTSVPTHGVSPQLSGHTSNAMPSSEPQTMASQDAENVPQKPKISLEGVVKNLHASRQIDFHIVGKHSTNGTTNHMLDNSTAGSNEYNRSAEEGKVCSILREAIESIRAVAHQLTEVSAPLTPSAHHEEFPARRLETVIHELIAANQELRNSSIYQQTNVPRRSYAKLLKHTRDFLEHLRTALTGCIADLEKECTSNSVVFQRQDDLIRQLTAYINGYCT